MMIISLITMIAITANVITDAIALAIKLILKYNDYSFTILVFC